MSATPFFTPFQESGPFTNVCEAKSWILTRPLVASSTFWIHGLMPRVMYQEKGAF